MHRRSFIDGARKEWKLRGLAPGVFGGFVGRRPHALERMFVHYNSQCLIASCVSIVVEHLLKYSDSVAVSTYL